MRSARSWRYAGIALVLAALIFPGMAMAGQSKGTIKIATQSPLSGDQSAVGEGIKLGTQLAIEKLKGPGRPVPAADSL